MTSARYLGWKSKKSTHPSSDWPLVAFQAVMPRRQSRFRVSSRSDSESMVCAKIAIFARSPEPFRETWISTMANSSVRHVQRQLDHKGQSTSTEGQNMRAKKQESTTCTTANDCRGDIARYQETTDNWERYSGGTQPGDCPKKGGGNYTRTNIMGSTSTNFMKMELSE